MAGSQDHQKKLDERAQNLKQQKESQDLEIVKLQTDLINQYRQDYGNAGLELPEFALKFGEIEHQRVELQKMARALGDELVDANINFKMVQEGLEAEVEVIRQRASGAKLVAVNLSKQIDIELQRKEIFRDRSARNREVDRVEMEYQLRRENRLFSMKQTDQQELDNASAQMEQKLKHMRKTVDLQNRQEAEDVWPEEEFAHVICEVFDPLAPQMAETDHNWDRQIRKGEFEMGAIGMKDRYLQEDIIALQKWLESKVKVKVRNEAIRAPFQERLQAIASAYQAIVFPSAQEIKESQKREEEFDRKNREIGNLPIPTYEAQGQLN